MKKRFTAFIAIFAATLWLGATFVKPARILAAEPILLHAIWIAIDVKGAVQIARIECDLDAESGGFKHGVVRPWITQVDGVTKLPPEGYELYACLGVG